MAGVLTLTIKNKDVLYTVYMPFLRNGGIFIPTTQPYKMGDKVSLRLKLLEEPEMFEAEGIVVWITPKGAQGNRAAGIGVQFEGEAGTLVTSKIETYLAGMTKSDKPTHTL